MLQTFSKVMMKFSLVVFLTILAAITACIVPAPKPKPPIPTPMHDVLVYVFGDNNQPVVGALVMLDTWAQGVDSDGVATFKQFPIDKPTGHLKITADGYLPFEQDVTLTGANPETFILGRPATDGQVQLNALTPLVTARPGIVRVQGRNWVDDKGPFYPLGATMMWAVRGMKYEPERLGRNLAFLKKYHFDYIRILGEVGWPGNDINPAWDDYEVQLAHTIDVAYDSYGLRTELTMIGGGTGYDYRVLAQKVADVVSQRQEKVISLEISNEFNIRDSSLQLDLLRYLKGRLTIPIAVTDPVNSGLPEVDGTLQYFAAGATYGTLHLDRDLTKAEGAWRPVRQTWDFIDVRRALSQNEPIGPLSSMAADSDPLRLAFNRAVSILNGVGAWVLHNGAGVFGQVDPQHGRPANLDEVQNIDQIMKVVRGVDQYLPPGLGDWRHFNHGWSGEPLLADAIWTDGANHGMNRQYTAENGGEFVSMLLAIKGYVNLTPIQNMDVDVIDVEDGIIQHVNLEKGEVFHLEPHTVDSNGIGGLILHGFLR